MWQALPDSDRHPAAPFHRSTIVGRLAVSDARPTSRSPSATSELGRRSGLPVHGPGRRREYLDGSRIQPRSCKCSTGGILIRFVPWRHGAVFPRARYGRR